MRKRRQTRRPKRYERRTRGGVLGYGYKSPLQNYLDYIKSWRKWEWNATTRWPGVFSQQAGITVPKENYFTDGRTNVIIPIPGNVEPVLTNENIGKSVYEYLLMGNPNKYVAIGKWDVRNVTDLGGLFKGYCIFNEDIRGWKTVNVTNMSWMFLGCKNFDSPLSWDTGKVVHMSGMFSKCETFNQDLSTWNTENVTDMASMFSNCTKFNRPLYNWNTDKVKDVDNMFSNCVKFTQDLHTWKLPALMQTIIRLTPNIPPTEFKTDEELRLKRLLDSILTMFLNCPITPDCLPPLVRRFKEEIRVYPNLSYGAKMNRVREAYDDLYPKPSMATKVTGLFRGFFGNGRKKSRKRSNFIR